MRTELVTTLKRQATELLSELERKKEPILITQHGVSSAYLVDVETYETLQQRMRGNRAWGKGCGGRAYPHSCAGQEAHESMAEVIWTNPEAAKSLVHDIFRPVGQLADHPKSGSKPEELKGWRYRQIVESPCRIFYREEGSRVFILHVMPGERLLRPSVLTARKKLPKK